MYFQSGEALFGIEATLTTFCFSPSFFSSSFGHFLLSLSLFIGNCKVSKLLGFLELRITKSLLFLHFIYSWIIEIFNVENMNDTGNSRDSNNFQKQIKFITRRKLMIGCTIRKGILQNGNQEI